MCDFFCTFAPNLRVMTQIEYLRKSLELNDVELDSIESRFQQIAKDLLNNFAIRKGEKLFRLVEIEFYYNTTDCANITFRRVAEAGEWLNHDWGVDLCFKSNEKAFGGILIRSIERNDEFVNGPLKCRELLFQFDALGNKENVPTLEYQPRENLIEPVSTTRWNISEKQSFRFCLPQELWSREKCKGYSAYPWDYKGNLKNK